MPEFGNSFSGNQLGRKMTERELIRAIRFMVAAEYEAIQLYEQLVDSIDNPLAVSVLNEIIGDERQHAGSFLKLLTTLDPEEQGFYDAGAEEAVEEMAKVKK